MPSLAAFFSLSSTGSIPILLGELVDHGLDRELGLRCAGSAVRGRLGSIDHHVVAHDLHVLQVIGCECAHATRLHRRALERARLVLEFGLLPR